MHAPPGFNGEASPEIVEEKPVAEVEKGMPSVEETFVPVLRPPGLPPVMPPSKTKVEEETLVVNLPPGGELPPVGPPIPGIPDPPLGPPPKEIITEETFSFPEPPPKQIYGISKSRYGPNYGEPVKINRYYYRHFYNKPNYNSYYTNFLPDYNYNKPDNNHYYYKKWNHKPKIIEIQEEIEHIPAPPPPPPELPPFLPKRHPGGYFG